MKKLSYIIMILLFSYLPIRAGKIQGTLKNIDGKPLSNVPISVFSPDAMLGRGQTDEKGNFALEDIPDGKYSVLLNLPNQVRTLSRVEMTENKPLNLSIDLAHDPDKIPAMPIDLEKMDTWRIPLTDGFYFPLGKKTQTNGFFIARDFREVNHLGEDWNGVGGGDTDLGTPIYAVAEGKVIFAGEVGGGWGKVIRILHNIGRQESPVWRESVYAHLLTIEVKEKELIKKGKFIGKMGNADGIYKAHLHLEVREKVGEPLGGGYSSNAKGFLDPSDFIKANQKELFATW